MEGEWLVVNPYFNNICGGWKRMRNYWKKNNDPHWP